jgi:uncharacterized protein (DUF433 family)
VSRNPNVVMNGALVFAGTCMPVKVLMDHLAAGDSLDEFLEGFPGVSREQAKAYVEMAREAGRCLWRRRSPAHRIGVLALSVLLSNRLRPTL